MVTKDYNQQRHLVYFSTDSGASENQTGFTNGIIQSLPKEINDNIKSLVSQTTPGFSDLNPNNYFNHFVKIKKRDAYTEGQNNDLQWIHHDVEGLQPNSQYTVSVFAYVQITATIQGPIDLIMVFSLYSMMEILILIIGLMTGNYIVNWNNAQKSTRFYFEKQQVYRFSHTFTTDASVSTTRVGILYQMVITREPIFTVSNLRRGGIDVTSFQLHL